MPSRAYTVPVAGLVDPLSVETLDVVGAGVQFLTAVEEGAPCVILGTIPPGGSSLSTATRTPRLSLVVRTPSAESA